MKTPFAIELIKKEIDFMKTIKKMRVKNIKEKLIQLKHN